LRRRRAGAVSLDRAREGGLNINAFLVVFAAGAAFIALWIDARFPQLAPASFRRSFVHAGVSLVLGQLVVPFAIQALSANGSPAVVVAAVLVLGLPALVYCFLAALWVMKLVAAQMRGSPR
jgi:hypothetical protein